MQNFPINLPFVMVLSIFYFLLKKGKQRPLKKDDSVGQKN